MELHVVNTMYTKKKAKLNSKKPASILKTSHLFQKLATCKEFCTRNAVTPTDWHQAAALWCHWPRTACPSAARGQTAPGLGVCSSPDCQLPATQTGFKIGTTSQSSSVCFRYKRSQSHSVLERNYKALGIIKPFSSISLLKNQTEKKLSLDSKLYKAYQLLESEGRQTRGKKICCRLSSKEEEVGKIFK